MSKYLQSEIFRINRKKVNIFTFIIAYLFIAVCYGLIVTSANNFEIGKSVDIVHFLGGSLILICLPYLVVVITSLVMDSESKEHGYLRALESGISRDAIMITKIILSFCYGIILLISAYIVHCIIFAVLFGWKSNNNYIILYTAKAFLLLAIPVMAMIIISIFIYFIVKNDFLNGVLYLFFGVAISKVLNLVSMITGYGIFDNIGKYLPAGTFKMILNDIGLYRFFQNGNVNDIMNINALAKSQFDFDILTKDYKYVLANVGLIIILLIILRVFINRRDFD